MPGISGPNHWRWPWQHRLINSRTKASEEGDSLDDTHNNFRTLMHAHEHCSQCLQCLQEGKENNQEAHKSLSPPSISQCKVTLQIFLFHEQFTNAIVEVAAHPHDDVFTCAAVQGHDTEAAFSGPSKLLQTPLAEQKRAEQPDAGASLDDKQCTGLALVTPMEQQHTVQR